MTQETIWMLTAAVGILALGLLYGYWIGRVGKQRKWSFRKTKIVAGAPLMSVGIVMQCAALVVHHRSGYETSELWTRFPWTIVWATGFFAMILSAKGSGVAWSDFNKDPKDNLSIR